MIVQNIVYWLYPKYTYERIDNICKWIQEALACIMYIGVFQNVYKYVTYADNSAIEQSCIIVAYYCGVDIWFSRTEIVIHHIICIWLRHLYYITPEHHEDVYLFQYVMMSTEVSTVFLTVRNILLSKDLVCLRAYKTLYPIMLNSVQIMILISFFYTRIYAFTVHVIWNVAFLQFYDKCWLQRNILVYGLYYMNVYWFGIMLLNTVQRLFSKKHMK